MKPKLFLISILISFTFEFRSNSFIRKLNEDSVNVDVTEPETIASDTDSYIIPHHGGDSDTAATSDTDSYVIPHHGGDSDTAASSEIESDSETYFVPHHGGDSDSAATSDSDEDVHHSGESYRSDENDRSDRSDTNGIVTPFHPFSSQTNPTTVPTNQDIPFHHEHQDTASENSMDITPNMTSTTIPTTIISTTTIPTIISEPEYPPNLGRMTLLLVEIGYFRGPFFYNLILVRYTFIVYYLKINYFYPLPVRMTIVVTVTYTYRGRGLFRTLQEENLKKDVEANCTRITYDDDINARYNCSFPVDANCTIEKITSEGKSIFIGLEGEKAPNIIVTSSANSTITQNGIQSNTGDDILKNRNIYILNNTILEENGLKFKLTGEASSTINDNKAILSFDEKGNGEIKNATCDVNKIEGNIYELDCNTNTNINAQLNGVSGITGNTKEEIIIIMKPDSDSMLNANSKSNYMGLYNRNSSSGLTGGAIAGIVIASIVALLAIAIAGMMCRKNKVPAPFQESTLGINVSNMTD